MMAAHLHSLTAIF